MTSSFVFHRQFSTPNPLQSDCRPYFEKPISRRGRSVAVRCGRDPLEESKNYYELLGVSVDSSPQEIKDAYRRLQKKYHPDIAGEKFQGHENTLILNKAYKVLMSNESRKEYDASAGRTGFGVGRNASGSVWRGPLRPHALFVDENACIGCRECVHHAGNTFVMDETFGTARVKVQYGDDDGRIEISVESCPVNCIHWVDTENLEVLEYLIQPQPRAGHGIFGQGWDRPANVFVAAKSFNKQQQQQQHKNQHRYAHSVDVEETPAQARARERAGRELNLGSFAKFWRWVKKINGDE
ncbi:chaperone protein dnaJ C76, chloroplastic-like isoform X2 [Henckelia pumila]|uniref:chaperone protein dnaJ C76, chloroplastic-like isoform X2 n=1 Tax=Henckelia pumila TaxID=405737 RepID=UPI003C6DD43E